MAAALGLLTGTLLGAASGYGKEKAAERQRQDEYKGKLAELAVQQGLQSGDPSFFTEPSTKKLIEGHFGPQSTEMLAGLAGSLNKPLQGFPTMGGGAGSATPSASSQMIGAAGGGGRFSQPQQVVGSVPSQMPPMSITGPNSAPEPTSVGTPQQRTINGDPNDPQAIRDHIDAVYNYGRQFPGSQRVQDAVKQEVDHWQNRLSDIEKQQEFDITKQQQLLEFGITKEQQQQFHQDSQAMHQETLASLNQQRDFMRQMAQETQDTKKQAMFSQMQTNLEKETENISKMLAGANPADRATVKTLLQQRNAQARQLKKQADAAGLEYDPDSFEPLTITDVPGWFQKHTAGMIGGSTATVTEDTSANSSAPTTSKSGRKMVADPKSPTGFAYAD